MILFSLAICGTASADNYVGGLPITTVSNGTVSGGVYSDSYYGFNNSADPKNVNYNFTPIPSNASVVNATLYTAVYCGNMQEDYPVDVNVTFNGKQIANQHLSLSGSSYVFPMDGGNDNTKFGGGTHDTYKIINDHCYRVTSDYFMWYNVTDLIKQNNIVNVVTSHDNFDGRIKLITLIVTYNDGSSNKIAYWINVGQDVSSYKDEDYTGTTSFSALPSDYTVNNETLKIIHMADSDGSYSFNSVDNHLSSSSVQGSYSGSDTWNVTSMYNLGDTNTLNYHNSGGSGVSGYYKLAFAILTLNYTEPQINLPDLQVSNVTCNLDATKLAGNLFSDNSNIIKATVGNIGSKDAGQFKVVLRAGNYTETKVIESLAAGASTVVSFTGFAPNVNGPITLNITADSDGTVQEANENNNIVVQSVNIVTSILPDLVPTSINVPDNLKINTEYPVTVTVTNKGVKTSSGTKAVLWATDENGSKVMVGTADVGPLPVNGTTTLTFKWTPKFYGTSTLTVDIDPDGLIQELDKTNNEKNNTQYLKEPGTTLIFLTSDNPGVNVLNPAAQEIIKQYPKVQFKIRTGTQISQMDESELLSYLENCDIFIGTWVTTEAYQAINAVLTNHPELASIIANKPVFLVLEPPASVVPDSIGFMKYSVINGVNLLGNFTTDDLTEYYQNTQRGNDYNLVLKYIESGTLTTLINNYAGANAADKTEIVAQIKYIITNFHFNIGSNIENLTGDNFVNAVKAYLSLVTLVDNYSSASANDEGKIIAQIRDIINSYNFNSMKDEMNACRILETLAENYTSASDTDKSKIINQMENVIKDITGYAAANTGSDKKGILTDFKNLIGYSSASDEDAVTMMLQFRSIIEKITGVQLENLVGENLTNNVTSMMKNGTFNNYLVNDLNNYLGGITVTQLNLPDIFDKAVLYKDLVDSASSKDMLLWALSFVGFSTTFSDPPNFSSTPLYGIYRGKWYSYIDSNGIWHSGLDEYEKDYFKQGEPCVGLIESRMYVQGHELQPYDAIISALEAKGVNIIPVVAYGATTAQLEVMLETFTNATDWSSFINDPSKYKVNVDAVIDMVAYGLGGDDFSNIIPFFTALNVQVIAAVHSDFETNAEYAIGTSGLRDLTGDKWWHIAILEDQGIVDPIFVGGKSQAVDADTGAIISGYVPYTENIEMLASTVSSWTQLKYLSNAAKKIAMIYYNYPPGKNNIAASYLDPIQSIINLLNVLKANGYNVNNIPANETILYWEMMAQGINVANWAPGIVQTMANNNGSLLDELNAFQANNEEKIDFTSWGQTELEKLANTPGVILYPVDDFMKWFNQLDDLDRLDITQGPVAYIGELCKRAVEMDYTTEMDTAIDNWYSQINSLLPTNETSMAVPILDNLVNALRSYVSSMDIIYYNQYLTYKEQFLALNISGMSGWGEAPGNIMTVVKNGTEYFVLPGIQFGNVLIAPEPQRGWEGNAEQLYHNSVVPPHYQYLAFYAYLQQQGYDAMVFMGRHATHEWMPGKEVLDSDDDFTSVLTGGVPQIYFYIMDGVAEGITAKRRGSAVIIDHLTPPMGFTQLYGGMSDLESLVEDYDGKDASGKQDIITKIKQTIKDNNLEEGMGVDIDSLSDSDLISAVNSYLETIANTFYPYGLDVIGQRWTDDQIALLVTSMLSVPFEIPGGGNETTSLQNEIALIMKGKAYDSLNAAEQNEVQNKCVEVVKELLNSDVAMVASKLTSNPTENLKTALKKAAVYAIEIDESVSDEVNNFLNALNGGYVPPGPANDPINNPEALPTGKNFYQDQAAEIPTKEAYQKAKDLTLTMLQSQGLNDTMKKIVVGIWDVETARDNGELICTVLYLLGLHPDWTPSPSAGSGGAKLKEMPVYDELSDLVRPDGWEKKRIDVVVVIDGNFRDLYSRQLGLMDTAFRIALGRSYYTIINNATLKSKYGDKVKIALDSIMSDLGYYGVSSESLDDNYVAYDWVNDFQYYMDEGMNCTDAGELAISRIFAPPENDYGAGVAQAVRQTWTWSNRLDIQNNYINRMGHRYSAKNWGTYSADAFRRALTGVSVMFISRDTNLYGVLDNDDSFDYWGGLSMAIEAVNGKAPTMYVLKYGNGVRPTAVTIGQYMSNELNTRYLNPDWIRGMINSGPVGENYISKFASDLKGWAITCPQDVPSSVWDSIYKTYFNNPDILSALESSNPYALMSLAGTLLEMNYLGYWKTDEATLKALANSLAQLVNDFGVACCDCTCGNIPMIKAYVPYINVNLLPQFEKQMYAATHDAAFAPSSQQVNPSPSNSQPAQGQSGQSQSGQSSAQGQSHGQQSGSAQAQTQAGVGASSGQASAKSSSQGASGDQGKATEINPVNQSSSSQTGIPIAAIVGIVALVCLVGVGYFRGKGKF